MPTKFVTALSTASDPIQAAQEISNNALKKLGNLPIHLAIIYASTEYELKTLLEEVLKNLGPVPLAGCTSPYVFTEENVAENGVALALISSTTHFFDIGLGQELNTDPLRAIQEATNNFAIHKKDNFHHSAILFIDGITSRGEETVKAAKQTLGDYTKFAGGAAGDDLDFEETFVFKGNAFKSDSVVVCSITSSKPMFIGVKHGHHPLSPPLKITKAEQNVIHEIEGLSAVDCWKKYIIKQATEESLDIEKLSFKSKDMSEILLKYELGIKTGSDYKIRFSKCLPDGSLKFTSPMKEGAFITIMQSNENCQIGSAKTAALNAIRASKPEKIIGAFIFDCTCRGLFLKDKFPQAIDEIKESLGDIPLIGFEAFGEIAMDERQLSGYHNATTVIMLLTD